MSIKIEHTRKVVVFSYSDDVKGHYASVSAARPGGEVVEKKQVVNHGHASVSFASDYHGKCELVVHGSAGGEDSGEIEV